MNELQALVKAESATVLYSKIIEHFTDQEKASKILMGAIRQLSEDLIKLHKNKWDGIWIRITTNFMMIARLQDRKSTRLNSSHANISYAVFCLKKKNKTSHVPII